MHRCLLVRVTSSNVGSNPAKSKQTMLLYPDATKLPMSQATSGKWWDKYKVVG